MKNPPSRSLAGALIAQLVLVACGAAAHPSSDGPLWPQPQPQPDAVYRPPLERALPNFQAPAAQHCVRPVVTRELPGVQEGWGWGQRRHDMPHGTAKSAPDEAAASSAPLGAPLGAPLAAAPRSPARAAPVPLADGEHAAESSRLRRSEDFAAPARSMQAPQQPQRADQPVTAGVVDDNGDFAAYLAFRTRTHVTHRSRDVRERYLLEVKDRRGRGVADAEVAVRAASGHAMWARTDAAGRAWLHPDAFDPAQSARYEVSVRKAGRSAYAQLERGQKSAVEVSLDAPAAERRARLDLVFLIDATGSMADEIDKLKTTLRSITADVARLPTRPDICFGLVAYRDRGDAFLVRAHDLTNDLDGFLNGALGPLQATGGGDYPEAMNEALHETVHHISWRGDGATRMVVLLADAPPHLDYGGPLYDEDMMAALGKGIKVFSVGASGLDKQGEYIQRQIAQYTGGRFVFLTYREASNPASGPGRETTHDVSNYSVQTLDRLIVRLVSEELAKLPKAG